MSVTYYDGSSITNVDAAYANDWHPLDEASILLWLKSGNPSHRASDFFGGFKNNFGFVPVRVSGSAIPSNATISAVSMSTNGTAGVGSVSFMLDGVVASPAITTTGSVVTWDATASGSWTPATVLTRTIGLKSNNVGVTISGAAEDGAGNFLQLKVTWTVPTPWSVTLPTMTLFTMAFAQPSAYVLPFDIYSGGVLYPAGTTFTWQAASSPTDKGWWVANGDAFAGQAYMIDAGDRPTTPRGFAEVVSFATSATKWAGGNPACTFNNHLVYAKGGYTVGTDSPTIRIYDGLTDRPIATIPNTSSGTVPKAIVSMLTANGVVYVATLDSGSSSADWVGRIFSLDIESGALTPVGNALTTGHIPYALCWHAGRLWCGTHRQSTAVSGKIFYFRPDVDTDWTADYDLATGGVSSCTALLSFFGKMYVGTNNAAASFAKVLVRDTAGIYTTSLTLTGGAATAGNGIPAMVQFGSNLYASYYNADAPVVSTIRKYDGTSWSVAYTGSGTTLIPYLAFLVDGSNLLAAGGGVGIDGGILRTTDGASWTDETVFLPQGTTSSTGLPVMGVVVH